MVGAVLERWVRGELEPICAADSLACGPSKKSLSSAMVSPASTAPTVDDAALLPLVMLLAARRRVVVVTGAGISTESGIPDYRSPGKERKKPMDGRLFNADADARQRYWARGFFGYAPVANARPNAGHFALAALEQTGVVHGVVTQNVDGLHLRAGSRRVVELHGSLARVRCLVCRAAEPREATQERMAAANPTFAAQKHAFDADKNRGVASAPGVLEQLPDGDVALERAKERAFVPPSCTACGGPVKPDVIFHGETLPPSRRQEAKHVVSAADAILVVGASLAVESGRSLVRHAVRTRTPVAIVNWGPTASDDVAQVLVQGRSGDVLSRLALALGTPQTWDLSHLSAGAGVSG